MVFAHGYAQFDTLPPPLFTLGMTIQYKFWSKCNVSYYGHMEGTRSIDKICTALTTFGLGWDLIIIFLVWTPNIVATSTFV